jgi:toxin ParE1/3/4
VVGYEYQSEAESEYLDAARYYARIDAELGISFVTEVESAIERARQFPESYGKIGGNYRHILTHRFSYAIIYELMQDRIFIWAVAHTSRAPGYWFERIQETPPC